MSLELIDRFLDAWEDPNYDGMIEQLTYLESNPWSLDSEITSKLVKDIEQVRFLRPSLLKMSEYSRDRNGLIKFYTDHNFVSGNPKNIKNAYTMVAYPSQYELDCINKYLNDDIKYIMQISFAEGLLALNFLEKTKAYLVTFAHFRQEYSFYGKMFIESLFPGRQQLILGIPQVNIPSYSLDKEPHTKFDLISYAGSRRYDDVFNIIVDCRRYAHDNTIVLLNYVSPHLGPGIGIYIGMNKLIREGILTFIEHIRIPGPYGDYSSGMAFLKYNTSGIPQKLDTKIYKSIEINIPLYEFTHYVMDSKKSPDLGVIKDYINKLNKAGIELDDYLKEYLLKNYNI